MARPGAVNRQGHSTRTTFAAATSLFFAWGFINANTDPLIAALRTTFDLTYAQALSTHLVFFAAFGLVSLPAAALLNRIGPAKAILVALGAMIGGSLFVQTTTRFEIVPLIFGGLFLLASGITLLQVAANPLAAALGPPGRSHFRLTLAQAFNSLGVVLGAQAGSWFMLADRSVLAGRSAMLGGIANAFLTIAGLLACIFIFAWFMKRRFESDTVAIIIEPSVSVMVALKSRWAISGAMAIAAYVGAEVSIGAVMINFLHRPEILDLDLVTAGALYLAPIYWGGALVGRFLGSLFLMRISASRLLAIAAIMATSLCLTVVVTTGPVAGYAALSIGFFNSIMFPTIFSTTLERADAPPSATSGLLCLAIVGGAILPLMVGMVADRYGLSFAFTVPLTAYFLITLFGLAANRTTRT